MGTHEDFKQWTDDLVAQARFGRLDRLGTANLIDPAARRRARDAIRTGDAVRLSRRLPSTAGAGEGAPMAVRPVYNPEYRESPIGLIGTGMDRVEVSCHGYAFTHMDGLNHLLVDRTFYGGAVYGQDPPPDTASLAAQSFFTRAVFADITAVRQTPWVSEDEPVTGADIERALGGLQFEPGDALVLYMGRDRFEAAGNVLGTFGQSGAPGDRRPGVGADGGRWIAEHGVSVLLWDLQDAIHEDEPRHCVHRLIHAVGLVIVDNCDLVAALDALRSEGRTTAALNVQPVGFPEGTGSVVEPFLVLQAQRPGVAGPLATPLYGAIGRFEEDGLVEPLAAEDRRRPGRITPAGMAELAAVVGASERVAAEGARRLGRAGFTVVPA